jgi:2-methylisocitrate lyase-like PEP mutase family enzyme
MSSRTMTTYARAALRARLRSGRLTVAPGVYDGLTAHLARKCGVDAAYLTGAGVAAAGFGLPDIGLVTQTEMVERTRVVTRALGDVPLIADADTGYGAPINVIRTVREYEAAGVAAIQLEDQAFPKRCGHLPDKELVSADEFCRTLTAALGARQDDDLLIVARTDARGPLGLDEAIRRANKYAEVGADVMFVEAPHSAEEVERIAAEAQGPLLLNLVIGGLTPQQSTERLTELGFSIAIHPSALLLNSALGALRALSELTGTQPEPPKNPEQFFDLVGRDEWFAMDEKYQAPGAGVGSEASV